MSSTTTSANEGEGMLPTSASQVMTSCQLELMNYLKSRRFLIMLIIGLLSAGLMSMAVAFYGVASFGKTALSFYSSTWGFSATYIVIFSAFFFGGDAISGEFQNKTGYFLVTNPVKRSSIYLGKWLAAFMASALVFVTYSAIDIADTVYHFGVNSLAPQFGEAMIFSLFYVAAALGFTFFVSSLIKNSSVSVLVSAVLLIFGFTVIEDFSYAIAHIEPWFLITYGAEIITNILSVPYPAHTVSVASTNAIEKAGGSSYIQYAATVPEGLLIFLVYFAATMIIGLILFNRREFN
ncbi:MAG: ABC transporter permease [Nitrososphaerota archaeon]|nr:ABC transporter permease [Nitrososphaerota archaeon]